MNNEIEEKIKKLKLKYKFIKDEIKRELFFEFAKKLKGKWQYLTVHMYEMKSDPDYEEEVESVFKELIEECEKGYDSGYKTELDELREKFDGLEQRYEAKRDTLFKLETVQGVQLNAMQEKINYLEDRYKESGGLKCLRDRDVIKKTLQKYFKYRTEWSEFIMKKRDPMFMGILDQWAMISLHKISKEIFEILTDVGSAQQTIKQNDPFKFCSKCGYSGNVRDIVCPECHNSYFKIEKPENIELSTDIKEHWTDKSKIIQTLLQDSDSKKTVALTSHHKRGTSLTDESPDESPDDSPDLKLPESTCEVCGRLMIKNQGCWFCICGHWKGQYNKHIQIDEEAWECPICHKTVFVGYTTHRHCLDSLISKINKMLEKTNKGIEMISEEIESIGEWDVKEDLVGLVNQLQGYLSILKKEYQEIL